MNKKLGKRIVTFALSLAVGATIFLGASVNAFAYTQTTGKVSSDNVKVRASASTTASQVSSLKKGDVVDIVDEATDASGNTWYKIFVNKSEYGYVRSDLVTKSGDSSAKAAKKDDSGSKSNASAASLPETAVTATEQKTATVTSDSVNVRQGAGTAYDSVGKVTRGETVTITGEATGTDNKTWYQVTFGANNKTGFVRSDLVSISEAAPAENAEGGEGENPEGAEGENPEGGEGAEGGNEETQSGVTSDAGDGTYSLVYLTDDEGTGTWYLYDNVEGYRVKVKELIEAAQSSEKVTKLASTNKKYKTIMFILGFLVAALAAAAVVLVFKLRDSLYYEEEDEEEEYDRYTPNNKRASRADEDDAYAPRRKERPVRDDSDEDAYSSRRAERRPVRGEDRDERTLSSSRRPVADDRSSFRRNTEERTVRPERDADDERPFRRAAEPERPVREAAPKRKSRNFIGDEDDFEFEFLDLDDEK